MRFANLGAGLAALALAAMPVSASHAQTPEEFYSGNTIDLYIGYSVGGGYDLYARMLAAHMGKHIPGNPTIVPRNMEGAGSLRMANWLYTSRRATALCSACLPAVCRSVRCLKAKAPSSIR